MSPKRRRRRSERNQGADPNELDFSLVEGTAGLAGDSRVAQCRDQTRSGVVEALQLGRDGNRSRFWHSGYDIKRDSSRRLILVRQFDRSQDPIHGLSRGKIVLKDNRPVLRDFAC